MKKTRILNLVRQQRWLRTLIWTAVIFAMPCQNPFNYAGDSDGDGYDDDTGDYLGDPYSLDDDEDGLSNAEEIFGIEIQLLEFIPDEFGTDEHEGQLGYWNQTPHIVYTDPANPDTDGDLWPDGFEYITGFHPDNPADGNADDDLDLLSNGEEFQLGTDYTNPDTDGGGVLDGEEVLIILTNPLDGADDGGSPEESGGSTDGTGGGTSGSGGTNAGGGSTEDSGTGDGSLHGDGTDNGTGTGGNSPESGTTNQEGNDDDTPLLIRIAGRTSSVFGGEEGEGGDVTTETLTQEATGDLDRNNYDSLIQEGWESVFLIQRDNLDMPLEYDGFGNVLAWEQVFDWKVTKTVTTAGGGSSPGTDYVAFNEKFTSGPAPGIEILLSSTEIADGVVYSGNIEEELAFASISASERVARGDDPEVDDSATTIATVTGGDFPSGNWSEIWLHSDGPVQKRVERTFLVVSAVGASGTGETDKKLGAVTLAIENGQRTSTVSMAKGDLRFTEVTSGVIRLAPSIPSTSETVHSVKLVPVDLDVIHPETGELEESSEDYSGSGPRKGGLVALKRNDSTPMTALLLKKIDFLPEFTKTRIKVESPDGSGSIKVWQYSDRSFPVISEETLLYASLENRLWMEGESISAGGPITITQQIELNREWVDCDSVSVTVVHAEIPVVMRAFIPHAWTEGEAPVPVATGTSWAGDTPTVWVEFSDCAGGNRQDFSERNYDDEGESKLRQEVIITPYKELHRNIDIEDERRKGSSPTTKFYKKEEDVPLADQGAKFGEVFVPGATPNWEFAPPNPEGLYEEIQRNANSAGNDVSKITSSLSGEAGSPDIVPGAVLPNIDFKFKIKAERVEDDGIAKIYFTTEAKHNLYPAYEMVVGNSDEEFSHVYQYKPIDETLPGPISLNSSHEGPGIKRRVQ